MAGQGNATHRPLVRHTQPLAPRAWGVPDLCHRQPRTRLHRRDGPASRRGFASRPAPAGPGIHCPLGNHGQGLAAGPGSIMTTRNGRHDGRVWLGRSDGTPAGSRLWAGRLNLFFFFPSRSPLRRYLTASRRRHQQRSCDATGSSASISDPFRRARPTSLYIAKHLGRGLAAGPAANHGNS